MGKEQVNIKQVQQNGKEETFHAVCKRCKEQSFYALCLKCKEQIKKQAREPDLDLDLDLDTDLARYLDEQKNVKPDKKEGYFYAFCRKYLELNRRVYRNLARELSGIRGADNREPGFCSKLSAVIIMWIGFLLLTMLVLFVAKYVRIPKRVVKPVINILRLASYIVVPLHNLLYYTIGPWPTRAIFTSIIIVLKLCVDWGFKNYWIYIFLFYCVITMIVSFIPDINSNIVYIACYHFVWHFWTYLYWLQQSKVLNLLIQHYSTCEFNVGKPRNKDLHSVYVVFFTIVYFHIFYVHYMHRPAYTNVINAWYIQQQELTFQVQD